MVYDFHNFKTQFAKIKDLTPALCLEISQRYIFLEESFSMRLSPVTSEPCFMADERLSETDKDPAREYRPLLEGVAKLARLSPGCE